jgi:hypothetical protein
MKSAPLTRKVGLTGTGFLRSRTREARSTKPMKSRGMAGRAPTAEEQRFMDAIAALGCLACLKDGRVNPWISLHHIDGRTKPGAHFEVLGLCAPHHQQDDTDPLGRPSVHGRKKTFVEQYGTENELLAWAKSKLEGK